MFIIIKLICEMKTLTIKKGSLTKEGTQVPHPYQYVPPFAKGGLGGISGGWVDSKILINSPSIPLLQRGKNCASPTLS